MIISTFNISQKNQFITQIIFQNITVALFILKKSLITDSICEKCVISVCAQNRLFLIKMQLTMFHNKHSTVNYNVIYWTNVTLYYNKS